MAERMAPAPCVKADSNSGRLDSRFLLRLAGMIGEDPIQLGTVLRVPTATVRNIQLTSRDPVTQTLEILRQWRSTSKNRRNLSAMYDELCAALSDLDLNNLVDYVREEQTKNPKENETEALKSDLNGCRDKVEDLEKENRKQQEETKCLKEAAENSNQKLDGQLKLCERQREDLFNENREQKEEIKRLKEELQSLRSTDEGRPSDRQGDNEFQLRNKVLRDLHTILTKPDGVETASEKNCRALKAMCLLKTHKMADMWSQPTNTFASKETLDLQEVVGIKELPCLEYMLSSGNMPGITSLNLTNNQIFAEPEATAFLAKCIGAMPVLSKLRLKRCGFAAEGFIAICDKISQRGENLKLLSIGQNHVFSTKAAVDSVVHLINKAPRLCQLFLPSTDMDDNGFIAISEAICQTSTRMTKLDCASNHLTDAVEKHVDVILTKRKPFKLDLWSNRSLTRPMQERLKKKFANSIKV